MIYKVTDITKAASAKRGKRYYAIKVPHQVVTNGLTANGHEEEHPPIVLVQIDMNYQIKESGGSTNGAPMEHFPTLGEALRKLVDPIGTFLLKTVLWVNITPPSRRIITTEDNNA